LATSTYLSSNMLANGKVEGTALNIWFVMSEAKFSTANRKDILSATSLDALRCAI
jgi:hypothetical protein